MISYSIDPSVLIPPDNPSNESLIKYFDIINICSDLIYSEDIAVYVFRSSQNNFDDEYVKMAYKNTIKTSRLPIDVFKKKVEDIIIPKGMKNYGKIETEKYYFESWFKIENISYSNLNDEDKINEQILKIGILNNVIYKNISKHFLLKNEDDNVKNFKINNVRFSIMNFRYNENTMNLMVQIKNINNVINKSIKTYNTVNDVYCSNEINRVNIIYGADVLIGLDTIEETAGPPDRIMAYIKTLEEFTEYKKNTKILLDDNNILQVLGCICTEEYKNVMMDDRAIKERMFDTGSNEKKPFTLHLKPSTIPKYLENNEKKRTVRIYFYWDETIQKIIIGWIGKHPYTPVYMYDKNKF